MQLYRLTLVIHSLNGGGAERQVTMLANHFVSYGHDVTLVTLDANNTDRYPLDNKIVRVGLGLMRVSRSKLHGIVANWQRVRSIRQAIQNSRPDCLFSFTDKMNMVVLSACKKSDWPVVICEMSDPRRQQLGWHWERWRRHVYPRCTACVTLTPSIASFLRPIVAGKPVFAIPSGIEQPPSVRHPNIISASAADSLDRKGSANRRRVLLAVGRLSFEKGFDRLLRAWTLAAPSLLEWDLHIAGEGPEKESLVAQSQQLKIETRVRWLGWQTNIWETLASADAFALSSRYEGFPLSILEAMAAGLPIITVDCTDALDSIIVHHKSGWMVPQTDEIEPLAGALVRVLNDHDLCQSLAEEAKQAVQRYDWLKVAELWDQLLERVMS